MNRKRPCVAGSVGKLHSTGTDQAGRSLQVVTCLILTQVRVRESWPRSYKVKKIDKCKITGGNWLTTPGGAAKCPGLIGGSVAWSDLVCSSCCCSGSSTALKLQLVGMHDASCCVSLRKARLPTGASDTELRPAGTGLSGPYTADLENVGGGVGVGKPRTRAQRRPMISAYDERTRPAHLTRQACCWPWIFWRLLGYLQARV